MKKTNVIQHLLRAQQTVLGTRYKKMRYGQACKGLTYGDITALLLPWVEQSAFPHTEFDALVRDILSRYPPSTKFPFSLINTDETETQSCVALPDFMANTSEDVTWLVDGLLPMESAAILGGPPNSAKSWVLFVLALSVATGEIFLQTFATTKGPVLLIDEESAPTLLARRFRRLMRGMNISSPPDNIYVSVGRGYRLDDEASVMKLDQLLTDLRPAMVIFDSLIRLHNADENSSREMSRVFHVVKWLKQRHKIAIVFADHHKKPGPIRTSLEFELRGSSDKLAFVDTLLSLSRNDDVFIFEHTKSRWAEPKEGIVIRLDDPTENSTIVEWVGSAEEYRDQVKTDEARAFLRTVLTVEWTPRKALVDEARGVRISAKAVDRALKVMLEEGEIEWKSGKSVPGRGGKAHYYRKMPLRANTNDVRDNKITEG